MEYEPLAPKPQPVFGQGFKYNGRLTVKGIPRVEPPEIKRLLFEPEGADEDQLREWRTETFRVVTKPWLEAQSRHYGVVLGPVDSYSKDELRELFRRESLKPDFGDIRRQYQSFMPGQFEKMKADWEAQSSAYKESCFSGRRQADFDNLATLEEKLNFDIDMFLETYYSDPDILPDPMPFRGINFDVVMTAIEQIKGLYCQKVGNDFQKMLWVGWDKKDVKQACKEYATLAKENAAVRRQLKKQHTILAHEKKLEKKAASRLQPHREYVANVVRNRGLEGSYVVEATLLGVQREAGSSWVEIRKTMLNDVFEATFNFMPAAEGVIILAQNDGDIDRYIRLVEPLRKVPAPAVESNNASSSGSQPGSKRKRGQNESVEQGRIDGSSQIPKRMRSDIPAVPEGCTRYYTRWRGTVGTTPSDIGATKILRENGEGESWIDFTEGEKAQFIAHLETPLMAEVIHGYKIQDRNIYEATKWETRPEGSRHYSWRWIE
ncbi:uncharacterized protein F4817DRAFT_261099 [Daldinia loculata]|uniref:uncharacterized protein n=1 Tax=Daldinia loculata TaxID=103429 RepID=UPI0020C47DD5|nr:uncharacterized protein F4817DRAFT_261099 [Daldinia loculata]KAI1650422.1 hypothetical protein F4817DRAFT_261099 [Daldinia loculata]